ncbi:GNAT family N-acetyltransferase [Carnobacterium sp.]
METYRLKIRPYQMTDLEAVVTIFSDAEMMTYYPLPSPFFETKNNGMA